MSTKNALIFKLNFACVDIKNCFCHTGTQLKRITNQYSVKKILKTIAERYKITKKTTEINFKFN